MKTQKTTSIIGFFAILAILGLVLTACPPEPKHTHNWGDWEVTTEPTYTTDGEETRTCKDDSSHKETRKIPQLAITSIETLATCLASLSDNTVDTPYTLIMNVDSLPEGSDKSASYSALQTAIFSNATKYVSLDFSGSSFTTIGDNTFFDGNFCTSLISIIIPDSVTNIGYCAFFGCTNLTSITIPNSVTSIGAGAFGFCSNLASVVIPNNLSKIMDGTFVMTGLTNIAIPNNVTFIGFSAFGSCSNLTSVTFEGTITETNLEVSASQKPFDGDLRDKYLAGGIGTYTTTAPVSDDSVWTKVE